MPCGDWFERIKAIALAVGGEVKTVASVLWSLFTTAFPSEIYFLILLPGSGSALIGWVG